MNICEKVSDILSLEEIGFELNYMMAHLILIIMQSQTQF